jgi:thioredoxin-dependent peroxiredoxin
MADDTSTLKVGDPAPEFELRTDRGETVRLSDFRGRRVVLYFYPKDDTTGCTAQACGFRDAYPRIEERNAVVLGVSPDSVTSHRKFKTKYDLPFTLLVDPDHRVAQAYGVWGKKSLYGKEYEGIIRSHFIIDEQGNLADVQVKVSPGDSVARALEALGAWPPGRGESR